MVPRARPVPAVSLVRDLMGLAGVALMRDRVVPRARPEQVVPRARPVRAARPVRDLMRLAVAVAVRVALVRERVELRLVLLRAAAVVPRAMRGALLVPEMRSVVVALRRVVLVRGARVHGVMSRAPLVVDR